MTDFFSFLWLGLILLSIVVELATFALVAVWFIPPAIVAFVLSLFSISFWIQCAVFFVLSAGTLSLSMLFFNKAINRHVQKTNADALIGEKAVVTETIDNLNGTGRVKIGGKDWSARSRDQSVIPSGQAVTVTAIEGVKLICVL